jgi:hypothetical protein
MITRIIRHNHLALQDIEDYVLKFEGDMVKILSKDGILGGYAKEHHKELIKIYENSTLFFMEEVDIEYNPNAMNFISQMFAKYTAPPLGMLYTNILGNKSQLPWYGSRYSTDTILNNMPPVAFVNKVMCPGLPMMFEQKLLGEIAQKAPIIYYPAELLKFN